MKRLMALLMSVFMAGAGGLVLAAESPAEQEASQQAEQETVTSDPVY